MLSTYEFLVVVHVPIAPPQRSKMGLQRHLGIYISFDSPFIIQYLDPQTGDVFMTCFSNCHFDETIFPSLRGGKSILEEWLENNNNITWNALTLFHLNPWTNQSDLKVQKIIHL